MPELFPVCKSFLLWLPFRQPQAARDVLLRSEWHVYFSYLIFYHILHCYSKHFAHTITTQLQSGGKDMNKRNFYVGMGMGLVVGSAAMFAMRPKKSGVKTVMGKTLKTMGEVADSVSELMGW